MFSGIAIGLISSLMQSVSFVFSRYFVKNFKSPAKLAIYSQLWMALFGVIGFFAALPFTSLPHNWNYLALMAIYVLAYNGGFYCSFKAVDEIESSRFSSLLGLKIIVIALFNLMIFKEHLHGIQYIAVLLTAFAGAGMNFSGMRISCKGLFFLTLSLIGFSVTDITGTHMVKLMPGDNMVVNSICTMSLSYILIGLVSSVSFFKISFEYRVLKGALPYAFVWFIAMVVFFASMGILGVVYGCLIQSLRGIFSVILGAILAKRVYTTVEPDVSWKIWLWRAVMATLMVVAVTMYRWN